jgi:dipeptidase
MAPSCLRPLLLLSATFLLACTPSSACTTIAAGREATADGATYTTATADCFDCDFRLAKVPARSHTSVSRAVFAYKANYPHAVLSDRAPTWQSENLEGVRAQLDTWRETNAIGSVPQVEKTFALLESGAGYALSNENMVTMGESTCVAKFASRPKGDGGEALLDISELSRIALERSTSAKQAVQMMGDLAVKYGYYGAEWDNEDTKFDEAGETLMVADPDDAWVFHILPDDTGKSAIWAAQRIPDGHVTAVANQFIIRKIDPADDKNFLYSPNMYSVAENHDWHRKSRDGHELDFARCFSTIRPHSSYSTHRVYRVFTLADPDLVGVLDPYPSALMDGYPFSVKPKRKLSVADLFRIQRDHYEGTPWDMTTSPAAQPFGDPNRYDTGPHGKYNIHQIAKAGEFGRAISIGRTNYAVVSRATRALPASVGAMIYFAQQQPDSSVFVPVYVATDVLPRAFTVGSLFDFNHDSMFWSVTAVANWVHRYYRHAIKVLRPIQLQYELDYSVEMPDAAALLLVKAGHHEKAAAFLSNFTNTAAAAAHATYKDLFPYLIARFHDGFERTKDRTPTIQMRSMFYSMEWLNMVGYFSAYETGGGDAPRAKIGEVRSEPGTPVLPSRDRSTSIPSENPFVTSVSSALAGTDSVAASVSGWTFGMLLLGVLVGALGAIGILFGAGIVERKSKRSEYKEIA